MSFEPPVYNSRLSLCACCKYNFEFFRARASEITLPVYSTVDEENMNLILVMNFIDKKISDNSHRRDTSGNINRFAEHFNQNHEINNNFQRQGGFYNQASGRTQPISTEIDKENRALEFVRNLINSKIVYNNEEQEKIDMKRFTKNYFSNQEVNPDFQSRGNFEELSNSSRNPSNSGNKESKNTHRSQESYLCAPFQSGPRTRNDKSGPDFLVTNVPQPDLCEGTTAFDSIDVLLCNEKTSDTSMSNIRELPKQMNVIDVERRDEFRQQHRSDDSLNTSSKFDSRLLLREDTVKHKTGHDPTRKDENERQIGHDEHELTLPLQRKPVTSKTYTNNSFSDVISEEINQTKSISIDKEAGKNNQQSSNLTGFGIAPSRHRAGFKTIEDNNAIMPAYSLFEPSSFLSVAKDTANFEYFAQNKYFPLFKNDVPVSQKKPLHETYFSAEGSNINNCRTFQQRFNSPIPEQSYRMNYPNLITHPQVTSSGYFHEIVRTTSNLIAISTEQPCQPIYSICGTYDQNNRSGPFRNLKAGTELIGKIQTDELRDSSVNSFPNSFRINRITSEQSNISKPVKISEYEKEHETNKQNIPESSKGQHLAISAHHNFEHVGSGPIQVENVESLHSYTDLQIENQQKSAASTLVKDVAPYQIKNIKILSRPSTTLPDNKDRSFNMAECLQEELSHNMKPTIGRSVAINISESQKNSPAESMCQEKESNSDGSIEVKDTELHHLFSTKLKIGLENKVGEQSTQKVSLSASKNQTYTRQLKTDGSRPLERKHTESQQHYNQDFKVVTSTQEDSSVKFVRYSNAQRHIQRNNYDSSKQYLDFKKTKRIEEKYSAKPAHSSNVQREIQKETDHKTEDREFKKSKAVEEKSLPKPATSDIQRKIEMQNGQKSEDQEFKEPKPMEEQYPTKPVNSSNVQIEIQKRENYQKPKDDHDFMQENPIKEKYSVKPTRSSEVQREIQKENDEKLKDHEFTKTTPTEVKSSIKLAHSPYVQKGILMENKPKQKEDKESKKSLLIKNKSSGELAHSPNVQREIHQENEPKPKEDKESKKSLLIKNKSSGELAHSPNVQKEIHQENEPKPKDEELLFKKPLPKEEKSSAELAHSSNVQKEIPEGCDSMLKDEEFKKPTFIEENSSAVHSSNVQEEILKKHDPNFKTAATVLQSKKKSKKKLKSNKKKSLKSKSTSKSTKQEKQMTGESVGNVEDNCKENYSMDLSITIPNSVETTSTSSKIPLLANTSNNIQTLDSELHPTPDPDVKQIPGSEKIQPVSIGENDSFRLSHEQDAMLTNDKAEDEILNQFFEKGVWTKLSEEIECFINEVKSVGEIDRKCKKKYERDVKRFKNFVETFQKILSQDDGTTPFDKALDFFKELDVVPDDLDANMENYAAVVGKGEKALESQQACENSISELCSEVSAKKNLNSLGNSDGHQIIEISAEQKLNDLKKRIKKEKQSLQKICKNAKMCAAKLEGFRKEVKDIAIIICV